MVDTLEQAKQQLRENWEKGLPCPCCTQFVKLYKRPIYGVLIYSLIKLHKLTEQKEDYYHITELTPEKSSGGGDFAKLLYWELIEEKPQDERTKEKRTSGYWKITEKGKLFVKNELAILSHVMLFDGKCYGFTGKEVTAKEVLGSKFNYEELMQ